MPRVHHVPHPLVLEFKIPGLGERRGHEAGPKGVPSHPFPDSRTGIWDLKTGNFTTTSLLTATVAAEVTRRCLCRPPDAGCYRSRRGHEAEPMGVPASNLNLQSSNFSSSPLLDLHATWRDPRRHEPRPPPTTPVPPDGRLCWRCFRTHRPSRRPPHGTLHRRLPRIRQLSPGFRAGPPHLLQPAPV